MNKFIYLVIFLVIFSGKINAQFQTVQIGVNGMTCSQCTKNVEMSIRKLNFVDEVRMDIQNTEGEITFKEGGVVDIKRIAQAVVDAGFSVRYISAVVLFKPAKVTENYCWIFQNSHYQFVKITDRELVGLVKINFIGKHFMPHDEYKKWESVVKAAENKGCEANYIYFITL